jgi:hypothetical protein
MSRRPRVQRTSYLMCSYSCARQALLLNAIQAVSPYMWPPLPMVSLYERAFCRTESGARAIGFPFERHDARYTNQRPAHHTNSGESTRARSLSQGMMRRAQPGAELNPRMRSLNRAMKRLHGGHKSSHSTEACAHVRYAQ